MHDARRSTIVSGQFSVVEHVVATESGVEFRRHYGAGRKWQLVTRTHTPTPASAKRLARVDVANVMHVR